MKNQEVEKKSECFVLIVNLILATIAFSVLVGLQTPSVSAQVDSVTIDDIKYRYSNGDWFVIPQDGSEAIKMAPTEENWGFINRLNEARAEQLASADSSTTSVANLANKPGAEPPAIATEATGILGRLYTTPSEIVVKNAAGGFEALGAKDAAGNFITEGAASKMIGYGFLQGAAKCIIKIERRKDLKSLI